MIQYLDCVHRAFLKIQYSGDRMGFRPRQNRKGSIYDVGSNKKSTSEILGVKVLQELVLSVLKRYVIISVFGLRTEKYCPRNVVRPIRRPTCYCCLREYHKTHIDLSTVQQNTRFEPRGMRNSHNGVKIVASASVTFSYHCSSESVPL
jgi:hypothetical protein